MDGAGGAAFPTGVLGVERSACGRRWRWRGGDPQAGQEIAERLSGTDVSVSTCTFSLSADKKKFTNKCVTKTKDGKQFNQTTVYDRTKVGS